MEKILMDLKKFRATLGQHPLAYMSAEFALDDRLPIFSGGLGVLAGDIVRQANDANLPFVAVGLLYKEGYFQQTITDKGEQIESYPLMDVKDAPIELVVNTENEPIMVTIPVKDTQLHIQIWEHLVGDVSVYLLDTDVEQNSPEYRYITRRLYGGDKETRILQEMVLGIGGVRALLALHIHPSIYHLNEGHSAFAIFEISQHYMNEYGMSFHDAYEYGRQKIVFTNHSLVPAANDVFSQNSVQEHLGVYAKQLGIPMQEVLADGRLTVAEGDGEDNFNVSSLALNLACRINAVSKLHSKMAKQMWPDISMPPITNGIHLPTWVDANLKAQAPGFDLQALAELPASALWQIHTMAKDCLVDEIKFQTGQQLQANELLIVWSRRFATYKRPTIIFSDIERLKTILYNAKQPVQLVIAGKAHPQDQAGHAAIQQVNALIKQYQLEERVVFVPNYRLEIAKMFAAGADVWLNTPNRGTEACGTSGMKSGANGVLQCSVSDGWVDEVSLDGLGWIIDDQHIQTHIYELLEQSIAPLYYQLSANRIPEGWVEQMRKTIELIWTQFSAQRALDEYIDILYRPALEMEEKDKHEHNWRRDYRTRPA